MSKVKNKTPLRKIVNNKNKIRNKIIQSTKEESHNLIPFTIKQIEIIKNPDSQFYPLFQFTKKYQKEQQEYFDKPFKEKGKILTKEINKKEKEIKNELLHLRMVRIVNDEFLSKKFLTSEKTFFDRKIKCE